MDLGHSGLDQLLDLALQALELGQGLDQRLLGLASRLTAGGSHELLHHAGSLRLHPTALDLLPLALTLNLLPLAPTLLLPALLLPALLLTGLLLTGLLALLLSGRRIYLRFEGHLHLALDHVGDLALGHGRVVTHCQSDLGIGVLRLFAGQDHRGLDHLGAVPDVPPAGVPSGGLAERVPGRALLALGPLHPIGRTLAHHLRGAGMQIGADLPVHSYLRQSRQVRRSHPGAADARQDVPVPVLHVARGQCVTGLHRLRTA
ncbi:hypothetical protein [Kribbella sp. NPDC000426]|uniref:hypothetical protein n=1 Tax=Kribbella sp. NPDC000426 TaxID=3154255 RepID=UPI003329067A